MWEFVEQNAGTIVASSISTIAGIIVGGYITWEVSRRYYVSASDELRAETEKICKLINLILCVLENEGRAELQRDEVGNIVGFRLLKIAEHDEVSVRDAAMVERVVHEKPDVSKPSE